MLSVRPPISLPQTTVPPAILEELIGEISSLASVYHKPAATFIGKGRLGTEDMQRRAAEWVSAHSPRSQVDQGSAEEETSREKALQTVVAGQQAENLLDFDADEPSSATESNGLASLSSGGVISSQQIASAAKSTNPLDELMDLFSSASMQAPQAVPAGMPASGSGGMAGLGDLMSPPNGTPTSARSPAPVDAQPKKAEEDLLGLL